MSYLRLLRLATGTGSLRNAVGRMRSDPHPSVLFDARLGTQLTGIGRYTHELMRQYATLVPDRVRPLCWRSQWREIRNLGLRPCLDVGGRVQRGLALPRVDVTHSPNFKPLLCGRSRSIVTVHDIAWRHLPDHYPTEVRDELDSNLKHAVAAGTFAICDSESARQDLINFFNYPAERTRTVHLGVSPVWAERRASDRSLVSSLGLGEHYILHVGAWVPRKDIPTLLAAWCLLAEQDHDLELALVGAHAEGWMSDRPRVEQWFDENPELASRVKILGHVDEGDLHALTRCAAAQVSSSRWEGFGLTILQALIVGVPVAAARNSSLPEVGGEHVHFAETGSPESLAAAIEDALADSPERRAAAAAHARTFSWERCARETLACYITA